MVTVRTVAAVTRAVTLVRLAGLGGGRAGTRRANWALHRMSGPVIAALGVRTEVIGAPRSGPALVVGNHLSWLDILVLQGQAPMRQVAEVEVGDWPVVADVARRTGTIFLDRCRPRALPDVVDAAAAALRSGAKVQAFPEAATRCGGALGRFHRCLFQAAIDAAVVVAPVTLRYLDNDGRPTSAPAFLGGESPSEARRRLLALRGVRVQVHWLAPIPAIAGTGHRATDRARLATLVERAVARDLTIPIAGRPTPAPETPLAAGPQGAPVVVT